MLSKCINTASTFPKPVSEERVAHCRVAGQQLSEAIKEALEAWLDSTEDKLVELGLDVMLDVLKLCMSGVVITRKYATALPPLTLACQQ